MTSCIWYPPLLAPFSNRDHVEPIATILVLLYTKIIGD
nr:MAG TPA: hypothetical protein [Caudoviricetes sp.]